VRTVGIVQAITDPLAGLGDYIRDQRQKAQVSLRQLAQLAGVSNPYLSQIERGLRRPSAEVLQAIAAALRISTPVMYLRAGLLEARESEGVLAAIAQDQDLNDRQRQVLIEVYESFRRENAGAAEPAATASAATRQPPARPPAKKTSAGRAATKTPTQKTPAKKTQAKKTVPKKTAAVTKVSAVTTP